MCFNEQIISRRRVRAFLLLDRLALFGLFGIHDIIGRYLLAFSCVMVYMKHVYNIFHAIIGSMKLWKMYAPPASAASDSPTRLIKPNSPVSRGSVIAAAAYIEPRHCRASRKCGRSSVRPALALQNVGQDDVVHHI